LSTDEPSINRKAASKAPAYDSDYDVPRDNSDDEAQNFNKKRLPKQGSGEDSCITDLRHPDAFKVLKRVAESFHMDWTVMETGDVPGLSKYVLTMKSRHSDEKRDLEQRSIYVIIACRR
jgi:hypothetical protein